MTQNWDGFVWETDAFCCMRSFCAVSRRIVSQTFRFENCSVFPKNLPILSLRGGHFQCPTRQSLTERDGVPERGTARAAQRNSVFGRVKDTDACEMRACARVKWRFRRSAVVVSLRDDSKFGDSVVFRSHASLRDSTPITLRLPRPQGGLAMTQKW